MLSQEPSTNQRCRRLGPDHLADLTSAVGLRTEQLGSG